MAQLVPVLALLAMVGLTGGSSVAAAPLPAADYLFVTLDDEIAVLNATTGTLVAEIPVPGAWTAIVAAPDNAAAYATSSAGVTVVDAVTATVAGSMRRGTALYTDIAVSPDGTQLYAAEGSNLVDIFDTATRTMITSVDADIPGLPGGSWSDLALSRDGTQLYASSRRDLNLTIIDPINFTRVGALGTSEPAADIAVSPDGSRVYVAEPVALARNANVSAVEVVDTSTGEDVAIWSVPPQDEPQELQPQHLVTSADGTRLYVALNDGFDIGQLAEFDTTTGDQLRQQAFANTNLLSPVRSADGTKLYVPAGALQSLFAFDLATLSPASFALSALPGAVSVVDLTTPLVTSLNAATFRAGVEETFAVTAIGLPAPALAVTGTLPDGVTFTDGGGGNGRLAGTATMLGHYPLTVTATNDRGAATQQFMLTVVPGPPHLVQAIGGGDQTAAAGTQFPTALTAVVIDAVSNPLAGIPVTFTVAPAGAATFGGLGSFTGNTGADGIVRTPFLIAGPTPGQVTVTATVTGVEPATYPLTIAARPPGPPTITALTAGDGTVEVSFTPGPEGSSPTTGYRVTATDVTEPSRGGETAEGTSSPITVTGLTNADTYTFTVVALSAAGDSAPSAASQPINAGIPASISGTPPTGIVGRPYSFTFTVTGAPTPRVFFDPGSPLPAGLTFDTSTATISGTPTVKDSKPILVEVFNGVGSDQFSGNVVIVDALGGAEPTTTTSTTTSTVAGSQSPTSSPTTLRSIGRSSDGGTRLPATGASAQTLPTLGALLLAIGTLLMLCVGSRTGVPRPGRDRTVR